MKHSYTSDEHHQAGAIWHERGLLEWIKGAFDAPDVKVGRNAHQISANMLGENSYLKVGLWMFD